MRRTLLLLCIATSTVLAASAFWIEAKAAVGQVLLQSAWQRTISSGEIQKAWPWADTWPVARLEVPKFNESLVVLEGVSGEAMAFGPGLILDTMDDGAVGKPAGVIAIGGHRDSHLQFLQHVEKGDSFTVQMGDGRLHSYTMSRSFVANSELDELLLENDASALVLITCYPFNALQTGGPLRYVVVAQMAP